MPLDCTALATWAARAALRAATLAGSSSVFLLSSAFFSSFFDSTGGWATFSSFLRGGSGFFSGMRSLAKRSGISSSVTSSRAGVRASAT
jgi:hypothetical protein